jgi:hypothetical protein
VPSSSGGEFGQEFHAVGRARTFTSAWMLWPQVPISQCTGQTMSV